MNGHATEAFAHFILLKSTSTSSRQLQAITPVGYAGLLNEPWIIKMALETCQ